MNNNKFNILKKSYLSTKVPSYLELHGLDDLAQRFFKEEEKKHFTFPALSVAFAAIALMIFTSTLVFASQPSKPGDNLYKVKILTDKLYTQITGDYQWTIDRRTEDIIKLKNEPNDKFDEAVNEYQQTLEEARNNSKDSQENEKEQLRQKLQEQEKKFQEISKENTINQKKFQNVVNQTRRTRGEVKGETNIQHDQQSEQNKKINEQGNNEVKDNSDRNKGD